MEELINKKVAFHIHTKFSYDSNLAPNRIIDFLSNLDYDYVIITDHEEIEGALKAKEYAKKINRDLKVIVGEEIKTDIGDIIGFPIIHKIKKNTYQKVMKEIKDQNGFIVLPHPFKNHDQSLYDNSEFIEKIDFIEIFNSRVTDDKNKLADQLRNQFSLKPIICSDAHVIEEIDNTYFVFDENFRISKSKQLKSPKRNIRYSQIVKYKKHKKYIKMFKYIVAYVINK